MVNFFTGQGKGFDIDLIKLISDAVSIPVIASSGAGAVEHFTEVFMKTNASAALAAGIFHRKEVQTYRNISRTSFVCKCWWRLLLFCLSFLSFFLFFKKKIYGGHSLSSQLFFPSFFMSVIHFSPFSIYYLSS